MFKEHLCPAFAKPKLSEVALAIALRTTAGVTRRTVEQNARRSLAFCSTEKYL